MLSQKIAWSNKKWDQRHQFLGEGIPLGEAEDAWDTLVELQQKQEKLSNQHCASDSNSKNFDSHFQSWASPSQASEAKIAQQIYKFDNTNLKMSRQLVDILKKERALAAKEKTELAALKYEQRVLRRADEFLADAKRKLTSKHDAG